MHVNGVSITVLSDNRSAYGIEKEHGFSLWIEAGGQHILFDTGCGAAMPHNAVALGVDLMRADVVALSHGHYDHTGNLPLVLGSSAKAVLYLHPAALRDRYSIHDTPRHIGMPEASAAIVSTLPESRKHWVGSPLALNQQVWLTGPISRITDFEDTGGPFFKDAEGHYKDGIPDDQTLWVETDKGLVICLGCCHSGVINTLQQICQQTKQPIYALIGGMHLLHASQERLEKTASILATYAIPHIYPCHCTGDEAIEFLCKRLGDAVKPGYAGLKVTF